MAEPEGNGLKSFIIGALLVIAIGFGWYVMSGNSGPAGGSAPSSNSADITVNVPEAAPEAPSEPAAPEAPAN